jgi:hypothetical protein
MSGRGTTVVAWVIGLGALAAQAVIVPVAAAMLESRAPTPVEVTVPALPAVQKSGSAVGDGECEGFHLPAQVIALLG